MEELRAEDPKRVGPFELHARLGAGAMGQVYLGERPGGERAAVKVIYESLTGDSSFRARFSHELEIARRVRAPWAAAVIDADAEAARPWFATEYIDAPSLERAVAGSGPIAEVTTLARRLAGALAELHALRVVHRDIKPSNVLLADQGPKLIDFGIARAADATRITHTGAVMGSPAFMSPEQAAGQEGGPASDVFSLAAVLVFAATGHGPFGQAANPMAMLYRVLHDEPDLAGVPQALRAALAPCLAKDPGARPTAAQLAHRLATGTPATPTPLVAASVHPGTVGAAAGGAEIQWTSQADAGPRRHGAMQWCVRVLRAYAVFTGRASLPEFWLFVLVSGLISVTLAVATVITTTRDGPNPLVAALWALYSLATALPTLAVGVRRLHDTSRSGWWMLLALAPFGGLVLLVALASRGDPGPNAFGPNPKAVPATRPPATAPAWAGLAVIAALVGIGLGTHFHTVANYAATTDNAQVDGDKIQITAPASGTLVNWHGHMGLQVHRGDVLGQIQIQAPGQPRKDIKSAGEGTIAVDNVVEGSWCTAGTQLATAFDLNKIYVTAHVDKFDIADVHVGEKVDINVHADPSTTVTGVVQEIQNPAEQFSLFPETNRTGNSQTVNGPIPVKILIADSNGLALAPGMPATVRIHKP